mmetsp:Transcript_7414/g.6569  ORF Transcript_7414/g.6569 Transcript_7414/m.6569 type:complete len:107 (-) Transcript_7414:231-551(-)
MQIYKNILDKQRGKRVFNHKEVVEKGLNQRNSSLRGISKGDDNILSELSAKKYVKHNYSTSGVEPTIFFTSPKAQSMSKKTKGYNRFNQPHMYDSYPEKAKQIREK